MPSFCQNSVYFAASLRLSLLSSRAVSYTHLDVYKRQVKTRLMKARARLSVLLREDWEEGEQ